MNLPKPVEFIISRLEENGYRAHVVGGAVRDFLLGIPPGDYDITTSATPDEMKSVFSDIKTVETGIKHGTLSVIIDGNAYEVTTYRIDGEYLDSRHPESVSFTRSVENDLSRRDFTVNAMAYSSSEGIIDLFGGRDDLSRGIIRAVGEPEVRFTEDALRIIRALRFASKLNFEIEEKTESAIYALKDLIKNVAVERIYAEWIKLLKGAGAHRIIERYKEVIKVFIPSLDKITLPERELFDKASAELRFISLFLEKGSAEFIRAVDKLHSDNKIKLLGRAMLESSKASMKTPFEMKLLLFRLGKEYVKELIEFQKLISLANGCEDEIFAQIHAKGECYSLKDMKITGNELRALGIEGAEIGYVLSELLLSVIKGETENETDKLLSAAVKIYEKA